jgi:hypothetical protein
MDKIIIFIGLFGLGFALGGLAEEYKAYHNNDIFTVSDGNKTIYKCWEVK